MDMQKLVQGARGAKDLVRSFGGLFILLIVFALVISVIVYQTGTSGTITVNNATKTNIDGLETSYDTGVTDNVTSASGTMTSLIILVVILGLFAAFIVGGKGKRKGELG